MSEEALLFLCDEAACHEDPLFYEFFTMDNRWDIIRSILKAVQTAETSQIPPAHQSGGAS